MYAVLVGANRSSCGSLRRDGDGLVRAHYRGRLDFGKVRAGAFNVAAGNGARQVSGRRCFSVRCTWFHVHWAKWVFIAVGVLTALYATAQLLGMQPLSTWLRLCFALIILFSILTGFKRNIRDTLSALPAALLISVALFSTELSELGVPGIWFPFGVGVSLSQFAYAAFDVALFVLLRQRLQALAPARLQRTPARTLSGL